ncbi:MAG: [protein-PII] uridylyltransferase [Betaproteobacteria bacterium]|nr:[protein-PII] uridylyltransferase [Betaproteobacteria bacterium]
MGALAQPGIVTHAARVRADWRAARQHHIDDFRARPGRLAHLLRGLCRAAELALRELWAVSGMPADAALLAVGGFGRGELFPGSDIDVLVLLPDAPDEAVHAAAERFVAACWDAGLEIGPSVRTVQACVEESAGDLTVQTSLLEARALCGDAALIGRFRADWGASLDPRAFFQAKLLEMRQRHAKFENTPYALEPNCKESPGGLRDLQILLWVARAAGLGSHWRELQRSGVLSDYEARKIQANERVLKRIRAHLHIIAGRREDRLVFDLQTVVADSLGLAAGPSKRAGESLMQHYYWAAKAVEQLNQIVLLTIEGRLWPELAEQQGRPVRGIEGVIDDMFLDKDGRLEPADLTLYERDPPAILETFVAFTLSPGIRGLTAPTLRALYHARERMDARFRAHPRSRAAFMRILRAPSGITHAMRLLNRTSVLGRYLPAFRRIVGRMQHDLFHVYTVDQHTLMVVRNVRRFFILEHAHEYPLCAQIAAGLDKPWRLVLAALFHDIAKGRGGDHSQLGAVELRRFARTHGLSREDTAFVASLVEHHLTMSRVAQKEDLSDPDVVLRFAAQVGNEQQLTALYLLTVADIRGTSPKVWNGWKAKLLEDLYHATLRVLGGHMPNPQTELEQRRAEARRLLNLYGIDERGSAGLWDTLDSSYFLRHDPADVAWHTREVLRRGASADTVVSCRLAPHGEGLQVMVYCPDQPDLFARICGFFDSHNFSILDAKVHTTRGARALDTFVVVEPSLAQRYRHLISLVESELARTLAERGALPEPVRGRLSRRVRHFPVQPRVDLRADERANHWILSVRASDRTGLLYAIARALAARGISVQLAKIMTLGERVEDTFLLHGDGLRSERTQIELESELLAELAPQ